MTRAGRTTLATHEVFNQPEPRDALNPWGVDTPLRAEVLRACPDDAASIAHFASEIGSAAALDDAVNAQRVKPELRLFDRGGRRIDEVAFHPGYHAMMKRGAEAGYFARPWAAAGGHATATAAGGHATATAAPGGHSAHAAMVYLLAQIEPGVCCPLTMTYAAVPALTASAPAAIAAEWVAKATTPAYDGAARPVAEKASVTIGMAMTEKQGGSDVRANATTAERDGEGWRLTGHKWFCSAPMSDAFLTLAYAEGGLTCFLAPRWTPDGARNPIQLQRLKDKLGNTANASAEIEYHGAFAWQLGEAGRGVATIIEMVHHTRLDAAMAPVGFMRRALDEAAWWTRHRSTFQRRLADQPLMQAVLADLALDWMGAFAGTMRVARAFDRAGEQDRAFARIGVALAKYLNNKRAPLVVVEAMECLGGAGYVEESPMPMLYKEAPLNGIWEGSGNVICLDVLRALARSPEAGEALAADLGSVQGADRRYDAALAAVTGLLAHPEEARARELTERLAFLMQAAELIRHGDPVVADAFCATRLGGDWGRCFGALPDGVQAARIAAMI